MGDYGTIKELVIETCMTEGEFPSYEKLTAQVMQHFPASKWKKTHYAWYKSKIKRGDIAVPGFDYGASVAEDSDDAESDVQETIEATLSLERDLHSYLAARINEIEKGLILVDGGVEFQTDAGRIDLLAKDQHGSPVVIELKAGTAKDSALGQLLGYMGCIASTSDSSMKPRGILIAFDFDQRVIYAAKALPHLKLLKYRVSFDLQEVI